MPHYPGTIKSKLPKTGTTIFSIMSALAQEYDAINLSQGYPELEVSARLKSLVKRHIDICHHQYAPMPGIMKLREKIAEKIEKLYGVCYDPETEVTVTPGATLAIYTAISSVVGEGDEVLIFTPAYDSYTPSVLLNGGVPIYIPLKAPEFSIPWDTVRKFINHRTKLILINNPHNPTGTVLSEHDMLQLQHMLQGTEIMVLSDEVYEHLVFDGKIHQSICRYPSLAERSFVVYSFGKTYNITGWKIGYCVAPYALMAEFRKVYQYQIFSVNTPLQSALADFMEDDSAYLHLAQTYQQKRDFFLNCLQGSRFEYIPSAGTYFQLLNYHQISDEKDTELAIRLTKEIKVASIPISIFYHKPTDLKLLRFCFAKSNEVLEDAARRLLTFAR